jgi:hypothetical protein
MNKESAVFVAVTSTLVTFFLLSVGASMWDDAPTRAEQAVGKGIVALACAAAIVALCGTFEALRLWGNAGGRRQAPPDTPVDWYDDRA